MKRVTFILLTAIATSTFASDLEKNIERFCGGNQECRDAKIEQKKSADTAATDLEALEATIVSDGVKFQDERATKKVEVREPQQLAKRPRRK